MRTNALKHKFIVFAPEKLEDATLYVSVEYRTVIHKCCCGCGQKIVTPLSPTDWALIFDGVSISLYPSIGNWSLPCKSHYWIEHNLVKWAGQLSAEEIEKIRSEDRILKKRYYTTK